MADILDQFEIAVDDKSESKDSSRVDLTHLLTC